MTTRENRWVIRLAVEGDLRFGSHHDCMRAIERIAARAQLPLAYSQGFNPRPLLSLVFPRPVGVSTSDDLLVVTLAEPIEGRRILDGLNQHAPRGMCFSLAGKLEGKTSPRPIAATYRLTLSADRVAAVTEKIDIFYKAESWPVQRYVPPSRNRRGEQEQNRTVDVKPMVRAIELNNCVLGIKLHAIDGRWAKPSEVLRLLDLDERVDLAAMSRVDVEYEPQPELTIKGSQCR